MEATKSEDHAILSSTRARQSWYLQPPYLYLKEKSQLTLSQLDAGVHPAYDGLASLPFYDEFDLSTVDILLITQ